MIFLFLAAWTSWPLVSAARATTQLPPVFTPEVTISAAVADIRVDGILTASEWQNAALITHFVERYPGENTAPEVETRTYVTYDEDHLYVAYVCLDDPSTLRATMCQRDQFSADDAVVLMIDTYGEAAWAYELFVNPYGVQKDNLWSSVAGDDSGFDLVWHAAAKVTDSGYQVEMAVPFASLRFPNRSEQSWRIDFWRNRPRESYHQYSWAAYDRNEQCWPCQWGTVNGIRNVRPGKGIDLLPTYIAHQSGSLQNMSDPRSEFENGDIMGELSLGGKYALASDMTLEASYNPDFSQIEADAAQVNVNTTIALFYPERRPFFQEGADIFRTLFNSFYTRTVNDPEYAVKMVSRKPGFTFGFMSAQDENTPYMIPLEEGSVLMNTGRSWVNVLRGSRSVGESSHLGFLVSDRRLEGGGYGSIAAVDGNIRLSQIYSVDGQFIASFTGEPDDAGPSARLGGMPIAQGAPTAIFDGESFHGNALITRLKRFARHWSFILDYNQVEPAYRTEIGYDPWVNYRNASIFTQYTIRPETGIFQRLDPQFWANGRWLFDGVRRWEHQTASLNGQLRWAQTWFGLYAGRGSEAWTSGVTGALVPYDGLYSFGLDGGSRLSSQVEYSVGLEYGRGVARFADAIGREISLDASLDLKPIDRLLIEPGINYVRSTHVDSDLELYRQYIVRTRMRFQVNRQLSLRLVVQYNNSRAAYLVDVTDQGPEYYLWSGKNWDLDPLITYRLSSFSVLYAGSTQDFGFYPGDTTYDPQWKLNRRQFFVKLQYLLHS